MPLLDRAYEAWSFNAIPRIGQMVAGDGRALRLSRRIDPQIPQPAEFRGDGDCRRLRAGHLAQLFRRHRGAAFGLEALTEAVRMSSLGAGLRLVRAGWIMVREGVVAALPGDQLAGLPKLGWRVARLFTQRRRHAPRPQRAAGRRRHAARAVLREARPVPGDAAGRRRQRHRARSRRCCRTAWRPSRRRRRSPPSRARSAGRSASSTRASASRSPPPRSRRCIRRRSLRDGEPVKVAVKVIRPGVRRAVPARPRKLFPRCPAAGAIHPCDAPAAAGRGHRSARPDHQDRDGPAAGGGRPFRARREHARAIPASACLPSTGSAPAATSLTMDWIDGIKMSDVEALRAAGHDLKAIAATLVQSFLRHTLRDGFFHADMHPGNLFVEADGTIVAVDLGISGGSARRSGASSPRSSTASSPATISASPRCISRPATCRPRTTSPPSPRRSGRSASRSTASRPRPSRWPGC